MTSVTINIESRVQWSAFQAESCDRWIAECEELGLILEADSLDQLHTLIGEALHLLFIDLLEDDELDAFLVKMGWQAQGLPVEEIRSPDDVSFRVPWELIAAGGNHDSQYVTH